MQKFTISIFLLFFCAVATYSAEIAEDGGTEVTKSKMGLVTESEKNWEYFRNVASKKQENTESAAMPELPPGNVSFISRLLSYWPLSYLPFFSAQGQNIACKVAMPGVQADPFVQLTKKLPSVRNQIFEDCAINAIAAAIEYVTTPSAGQSDMLGLLPLKISRVGLYNETIRRAYFPTLAEWKNGWSVIGSNDQGVTLGEALITLDKYGAFPEADFKVAGFSVDGWGYDQSFKGLPIPQEMFLTALDTDFSGINACHQKQLLDGGYLISRDVCSVANPYAKVAQNVFYEPIEPPRKIGYTEDFYSKIRQYLAADKPIIIGIEVTSAFKHSRGRGAITTSRADSLLGPHAILALGYGNYAGLGECFYVQNSWGAGWGKGGRWYISKEYFEKYFYGGFAVSIPGFFS